MVPMRWCALLCLLALGEGTSRRYVRYADIPVEGRGVLETSAEGFPDFLRSVERRTAERLAEGENDHLVFYLLESGSFTGRPKIEPAVSASEFFDRPGTQIPRAVTGRIEDFIKALGRPGPDERLSYFRKFLANKEPLFEHLCSEYARAMKFLYRKEFGARDAGGSLYQERGHSSDTQVEANFAVWTALSVLKALDPPARLNRVLIVGPGLDFAPRTDFLEPLPPQSYQPFAIADALLGLGLAQPERIEIQCLDINPRVVDWINAFTGRRERRLALVSRAMDPLFAEYFRDLGRHIGSEAALGSLPAPYQGKSLTVSKSVAGRIRAGRLNILTERYQPPPRYDLAVVTNVFVYFNNVELLLALTNIESMLRPGGYLVHNEVRAEVESFGAMLGLAPVQARSLRLTTEGRKPLFDTLAIHRKTAAGATR